MKKLLALLALTLFVGVAFCQEPASTSTDLFVMFGSDHSNGNGFRANYNIGIGHTFSALKNNPLGDEVTFSYTYEKAGGGAGPFFKNTNASHTETLGLMKNFGITKGGRLTGYTWLMLGLTSMVSGEKETKIYKMGQWNTLKSSAVVQNRMYHGDALGLIIHIDKKNAIWIQETWNKVVTCPWYLSTTIGYTRSW